MSERCPHGLQAAHCASCARPRAKQKPESPKAAGVDADEDAPHLSERLATTSELTELGYNVRTADRAKRWRVLLHAVDEFGFDHVVWRLEGNIALRLKQKDGSTKYAYAIREWRHDLDRLRLEFDR